MDHHAVRIHLIRHEKTRANFERKYIGWTDEPIATRPLLFFDVKPNIVYGSDLLRCQQTADMYFPTAQYVESRYLREMNFGDFEMKTYEQLKHLKIYRDWIDAPEEMTIPNGESFAVFKDRIVIGVKEIVQAPGDYFFIVHGGVIRMLLSLFGPFEKTFQEATALHRTQYTLEWPLFKDWEDGLRCTSYSEALLTVKDNL